MSALENRVIKEIAIYLTVDTYYFIENSKNVFNFSGGFFAGLFEEHLDIKNDYFKNTNAGLYGRYTGDGSFKWHYEIRDSKNKIFENLTEIRNEKNGWYEDKRNLFHQYADKNLPRNRKYCHPDGREVVFDGRYVNSKNPILVTDPLLKGSYNYATPMKFGDIKNFYDIKKYINSNIGHAVYDIAPYFALDLLSKKNK